MGKRASGEGTIFKRPDGLWVGRLTLERGKRHQVTAKTQAAVRAKLEEAKTARAKGLPLETSKQTVSAFLTDWLATSIKPHRRHHTWVGYEVNVRLRLVPKIGHHQLVKLAPGHVQKMLNELRDQGLSPRSVQYAHATLRAALHQALKWGLVNRNVATLVDLPRLNREEVQPLTPDQARELVKAVRGDRLEALYVGAMALGLRRGEALGLRWADLDLQARTVKVRKQVQRIDGKLQLVDVKTDHSRRIVDLPDPVVAVLQARRIRQLEEQLMAGPLWQDSGLVFTTSIGTPLEAGNVWRSFKTILEDAELPHIRFHDLRHTAASLLLAQGAELWEVSKLLGHSGIQITNDVYGHLYPQARRAAADRMGTFLAGAV